MYGIYISVDENVLKIKCLLPFCIEGGRDGERESKSNPC